MSPNMRRRRGGRESDSNQAFSGQARQWVPKTELGRKVAGGQITSMDEVYASGQRVLEPQIVDTLLPDMKDEVLEVTSTQRMTAYGRKQQMRAVVVMGSERGFICVGVGKAAESRDAIGKAIEDAKKNVVKVPLGCASWECRCGTRHSITRTTTGKNSSTQIKIMPAPRGVGIVANETAKKVLELAGIKDVWTQSKGRTRNVLNMVLATVQALDKLNKLKEGNAPAQEATATPNAQEN
jgi:small subunit ribosomal protein S5